MSKLNRQPLSKEARQMGQNMLDFIKQSPASWQACHTASKLLEAAGFEEVTGKDLPNSKVGDKRYITINGSSLIAWSVGKAGYKKGARIWGSHLDSPALQIKPNSLIEREGIYIVNCAVYGGALLSTFFDRPLGLAGVATIRSHSKDKAYEQVMVDLAPLKIVLPNLAIHFNRAANDGVKIEKQKVLLPMLGLVRNENVATDAFSACHANKFNEIKEQDLHTVDNGGTTLKVFEQLISEKLDCPIEDIIDYDIRTYVCEPPCFVGLNDELMSTQRLDDLGMSIPGVYGFMAAHGQTSEFEDKFGDEEYDGLKVLYLADNEEIGSNTKQGADTIWLRQTIEAICLGLGMQNVEFPAVLEKSIILSADVAHAVHPNYGEFSDQSTRPRLNEGPVLKINVGKYSTDAASAAAFRLVCEAANVPMQTFMNRTDLPGGTTIGPITTAYLPITNVDIGNPILAMHSARELAGVLDSYYAKLACEMFFRKPLV